MKNWMDMTNEERVSRSKKCAVVSALIAIIFIVIMAFSIQKRKELVEECTEITTGGVITVYSVSRSKPEPTLTAEYEVNGVRYSTSGRYHSGYSVSDSLSRKPVTVHYSPEDPSKAYAADEPESNINWLYGVIIGIFALGSVLFILQAKKLKG